MTVKTYNVGAYPFSISCKASCQFAGKDESKRFRKINQATFVAGGGNVSAMRETCKANAKGGRFIDWTGPLVPGLYHCQRCGTAHNVAGFIQEHSRQAKTQPAKVKAVQVAQVETAPQTGQAFDALQFLIECRDFKRGKWLTKHNGENIHALHTTVRHLREQNGLDKPAATAEVKRLKRQVECMDTKPVETEADKAEMTRQFVDSISPPQTKPAPKAQAKPVPKAEGSIEVMSVELFAELSKHAPIQMKEVTTTILVETITVNGSVFRCA